MDLFWSDLSKPGFTCATPWSFGIVVIQWLQKCWIEKMQTDLTRVKTIQYDAVGGVLDCFYKSEEAWIF